MTKVGNNDKRFERAVLLGNKNKKLIPRIRNWCKHIQLEDVSGGLVAEMYRLPTTLQISCPHTNDGGEAANLEWMAHDFILNNCRSCKFHDEVCVGNFGGEVIDRYSKYEEQLKKKEKEDIEKKKALKDQVEVLIAKEKSKSEITKLSILSLIQSLENIEDRDKSAIKIIEASKLSPNFFSKISLDYLSLFFDDERIGKEIIQAVENACDSGKKLTKFCIDNLIVVVEQGRYVDQSASLLKLVFRIGKIDDSHYHELIKCIINSLKYEDGFGGSRFNRPSYPHAISLLVEIYKKEPDLITNLFSELLIIDSKKARVNVNCLLQELFPVLPEAVLPHCSLILKSLEFEEDGYGAVHADAMTCLTLSKIYKSEENTIMGEINAIYPVLTDGAKIELFHFFELVLFEEDLVVVSKVHTDSIIKRLLDTLSSKGGSKDLKKEALSVIKRVSIEKSHFISGQFDVLVGVLIERIRAKHTFDWYQKELKKPQNEISTFNPLQGMDYVSISLEESALENSIQQLESIIQNFIKNGTPVDSSEKMIAIISNLSSSSDGLLKSKLIGILRKSEKSLIILSDLLPSIYNFLLDIDSVEVRYEGIAFVATLINEHDQLVTQTLIDLIKVFLKDPDVGVKGKAIDTLGALMKKFPHEIEQDQINIVINDLSNSFVFIHKKAAGLSYKIFPFLDESQQRSFVEGLLALEGHYFKKKDFDFCEKLVDMLLFQTRGTPKLYSFIVSNYLVKYCNSKNYYTDSDFIKKLTFIRLQNNEFNSIWLEQALGFLYRTNPDRYNRSFDNRNDLFETIYQLPQELVVSNLESIKRLLIQKIEGRYIFDVFALFSILAYFNQYKLLEELSDRLEGIVEQNKSNEFVIQRNEIYKRISVIELTVANCLIDKTFIKTLLSNE